MNSEIPNCFYRISIKGLILDESRMKFLIVQEDNGKWDLPGGGLDWEEKPHVGLRREIQEEMRLVVTSIKDNPSYFLTAKSSKGIFYSNILYEITVNNLDFTPSDECVAIQFVTAEEVKTLEVFPNVLLLADMFDPKNH